MSEYDVKNNGDRRGGHERRDKPRRADDLRTRIQFVLQLCGLIAVGYTGVSWLVGPVLGKHVVGPSASVDSVQSADISQIRTDMRSFDQKLSDVLDITCQIATSGQYKSGIIPSACKEAK